MSLQADSATSEGATLEAATSDNATSDNGDTECSDPVAGAWVLVGVFLMSAILIGITVVVSHYDLAGYNLHIALGIATVQATLVAAFFMRLVWERPFHRIIVVGSLLFAAVFLTLCTIDIRGYLETLDATSPAVQERLEQGRQSLEK